MKIIRQKGQVALIVLVISALALTLGLSLSDKIRSGVKISKDDELLQKAFDAAESTLDNYYARQEETYTSSTNDAFGSLSTSPIVGTTIPFSKYVRSDEYAFFWLVGHEDNGEINYGQVYDSNDLTICYNTFTEGGLLVYYFYRDGSSYEVTRSAINLSGGYFGSEGIDVSSLPPGQTCDGFDSHFLYSLSPASVTPLLLIVKPVGGGSNFMVSGGNFPSQGNTLDALGTSGTANAPIKEENRWDPTKYMFFMLEGIVSRSSIN